MSILTEQDYVLDSVVTRPLWSVMVVLDFEGSLGNVDTVDFHSQQGQEAVRGGSS